MQLFLSACNRRTVRSYSPIECTNNRRNIWFDSHENVNNNKKDPKTILSVHNVCEYTTRCFFALHLYQWTNSLFWGGRRRRRRHATTQIPSIWPTIVPRCLEPAAQIKWPFLETESDQFHSDCTLLAWHQKPALLHAFECQFSFIIIPNHTLNIVLMRSSNIPSSFEFFLFYDKILEKKSYNANAVIKTKMQQALTNSPYVCSCLSPSQSSRGGKSCNEKQQQQINEAG